MSDIYAEMKPGDKPRLSATAWNDLIRMLKWWKNLPPQFRRPRGPVANPAIVKVLNSTGSTVQRYQVLGIDQQSGLVISPDQDVDRFRGQLCFNGVLPAAHTHSCSFVVALDSIPSGSIGDCAISGAVQCQIQVTSANEGFTSADILAGDSTQLTLVVGGFRVLYVQSGTGTKWGVVHLGNRDGLYTAAIKAGQPTDIAVGSLAQFVISGNGIAPGTNISADTQNIIAEIKNAAGRQAIVGGLDGVPTVVSIDPCG